MPNHQLRCPSRLPRPARRMYNQDIHQRIATIRHRTVHRVDIQLMGDHRLTPPTITIILIKDHTHLPRILAATHPTVKLTARQRMARRQPTVLTEGNPTEVNLTEDNLTEVILTEDNLITAEVSVNRPTVNPLTVNHPSANLFNQPSHRHQRSPFSNRVDPASVSWPRKRWSTPA